MLRPVAGSGITALSGTVSAGALCAFSLVPAVIGSDGIYENCGASRTSVEASVSALSDCYASGHISLLPLIAQGISVMPKGVDSMEGPAFVVARGSHGLGSVLHVDHNRCIFTGMGSALCGLLEKRDLVNSAKGAAYQLPRATDCFARGDAVSLSLLNLSRYLLVWSSANFLSLRAKYLPEFLNLGADLLSRGGPIYTEWRLHPLVVAQ